MSNAKLFCNSIVLFNIKQYNYYKATIFDQYDFNDM